MENINKSFAGVSALSNVDFTLEAQEIHALLGASGAGKTVLINILVGMDVPDKLSGPIHVEDQILPYRESLSKRRKQGLYFLGETPLLFPELSLVENLKVLPAGRGSRIFKRAKALTVVQEALATFGLRELPPRQLQETPVKDLPSEFKKVVELHLLFLKLEEAWLGKLPPKILILDEPARALRGQSREILFSKLQSLRDLGLGIVYVTRALEEVRVLADRVTVLRDGLYVATSTLTELSDADLTKEMLGVEENTYYPKYKKIIAEEALRVENLGDTLGAPPEFKFLCRYGELVGISSLEPAVLSYLARCLTGRVRDFKGQIYLQGRLGKIRSPRQALAQGVFLVPALRPTRNFLLAHVLAEVRKLQTLAAMPTSSLTSAVSALGEARALGLLPALSRVQVYIFNEPTRYMDMNLRRCFYEALNYLLASGKAVILLSRDLAELLGMSDRIYIQQALGSWAEFNKFSAKLPEVRAAYFKDVHVK